MSLLRRARARRALHAPTSRAAIGRRRRRRRRSREPWAAASGGGGRSTGCSRSTSARTCPDDLIAKIDIATMAHAPRGALAVPRPRADGVRGLDPRRAEGARHARRSGSCARRCAPGCRTRSSTAPSRASACRWPSWLRGDLRGMVARRPARPRYARPRLLPEDAVSPLLARHAAGADGDAPDLGAARARALAPRVRRPRLEQLPARRPRRGIGESGERCRGDRSSGPV